jgi:hypothetical protein
MNKKYVSFKFKKTKINQFIVIDVDYHRNGVSGIGFMTGLFSCNKGDLSERGMFVFTLFPSYTGKNEDETFDNCIGDYRCAVLRLEDLNNNTAENAWRGDYFYHNVVQEAVKEYQRQFDKHYKFKNEEE